MGDFHRERCKTVLSNSGMKNMNEAEKQKKVLSANVK